MEKVSGLPIPCIQASDDSYEQYRLKFESDPNNAPFFELWTATGQAIRGGFLNQLTTAVRGLTGVEPVEGGGPALASFGFAVTAFRGVRRPGVDDPSHVLSFFPFL